MIDLLPCPFCGADAKAFIPDRYDGGGQFIKWFAGSERCGCVECNIEMPTEDWQKRYPC